MKPLGAGLYADDNGDVWYFSWRHRDWCRSKHIPNVAEWERRQAVVAEMSGQDDSQDQEGEATNENLFRR
jgi:hypothetical protein